MPTPKDWRRRPSRRVLKIAADFHKPSAVLVPNGKRPMPLDADGATLTPKGEHSNKEALDKPSG